MVVLSRRKNVLYKRAFTPDILSKHMQIQCPRFDSWIAIQFPEASGFLINTCPLPYGFYVSGIVTEYINCAVLPSGPNQGQGSHWSRQYRVNQSSAPNYVQCTVSCFIVNGATEEADPTVYTGKVIRPLRSVDPTQTEYQGMIEVMEDGKQKQTLPSSSLLQKHVKILPHEGTEIDVNLCFISLSIRGDERRGLSIWNCGDGKQG